MVDLVIGYAVGTLQILLFEWARRRIAHQGHLRTLRADLRRAGGFQQRFDFTPSGEPSSDAIPRPPSPSPAFADLVVRTDFYLTDEHDDDNTQEALLGILDGCASLEHYVRRFHEATADLRRPGEPAHKILIMSDMREIANAYDRDLEKLLYIISDAIRDIDRRVQVSGLWYQARKRPIGRLRPGRNPPMLTDNDPRLRPEGR